MRVERSLGGAAGAAPRSDRESDPLATTLGVQAVLDAKAPLETNVSPAHAPTLSESDSGRETSIQCMAPGFVLGGRYQIRAHLGSGGMGAVYLGHDRLVGHEVALKFVRRSLAGNAGDRDRLRQEVRLAQTITHPNVARTYTLEELEGHLFIVMEALHGPTLAERITKGPLAIEEARHIGCDLLAGLAAAHARGVIHRDVKPLNIKVCDDGRVVLMDFGLARIHEVSTRPDAGASGTPSGAHTSIVGTPGYIAPEILRGHKGDVRSDLYSFGVALFEMLAGRPPFVGTTPAELLRQHLELPAPDLASMRGDVPPGISAVVAQLLAKEPSERFASALETRRALEPALAGRAGRSRRILFVTGTVVSGVLLGGYLLFRVEIPGSHSAPGSLPNASGQPVPMPRKPKTGSEAAQRGEEIVAQLDAAQSLFPERMMVARMRLVESNGEARERRFKALFKGDSKRLIRFLSPEDSRGIALLVESPEVVHMYTPENGQIRPLDMHVEQQGLLGSDITTDDLTRTRIGPAYTARLISEVPDKAIVELVPRVKGGDVSKVMATANLKYLAFTTLDYYDQRGQHWKRRSSSNFVETGHRLNQPVWWPKLVSYADLRRKHTTELHVEEITTAIKVPDSVFSVLSLGRSDWEGLTLRVSQ